MNASILLALGAAALLLGTKRESVQRTTAPTRAGVPPEWLQFFSGPHDPTPGTFYQVTAEDLGSDNPIYDIASRAIHGRHVVGPVTFQYTQCLAVGAWNPYYFGPGLALALRRVNDDAIRTMAAGRWPSRTTAGPTTGGPTGSATPSGVQATPAGERSRLRSLGLLWLPNVLVQGDKLTCPYPRATLDPPPDILGTLGGTPPPFWQPGPKGMTL